MSDHDLTEVRCKQTNKHHELGRASLDQGVYRMGDATRTASTSRPWAFLIYIKLGDFQDHADGGAISLFCYFCFYFVDELMGGAYG